MVSQENAAHKAKQGHKKAPKQENMVKPLTTEQNKLTLGYFNYIPKGYLYGINPDYWYLNGLKVLRAKGLPKRMKVTEKVRQVL